MVPVSLARVTEYLDDYLRIEELPDENNAVNGLQVENGINDCAVNMVLGLLAQILDDAVDYKLLDPTPREASASA